MWVRKRRLFIGGVRKFFHGRVRAFRSRRGVRFCYFDVWRMPAERTNENRERRIRVYLACNLVTLRCCDTRYTITVGVRLRVGCFGQGAAIYRPRSEPAALLSRVLRRKNAHHPVTRSRHLMESDSHRSGCSRSFHFVIEKNWSSFLRKSHWLFGVHFRSQTVHSQPIQLDFFYRSMNK